MKSQTSDQMRSYYQKWLKSSISKRSFAKEHKIVVSTFYYWVNKFESALDRSSDSEAGFVRLDSATSDLPLIQAVLHFPSGVRLEWHGRADSIHLLKTLL